MATTSFVYLDVRQHFCPQDPAQCASQPGTHFAQVLEALNLPSLLLLYHLLPIPNPNSFPIKFLAQSRCARHKGFSHPRGWNTHTKMLKYPPSRKRYYNNRFKDEGSTKNALNTYHQLMRSILSFILSSKLCLLSPNCFLISPYIFLNYKLLRTNIPNRPWTSETGTGLFFSNRMLPGGRRNYLQSDQEEMSLPL